MHLPQNILEVIWTSYAFDVWVHTKPRLWLIIHLFNLNLTHLGLDLHHCPWLTPPFLSALFQPHPQHQLCLSSHLPITSNPISPPADMPCFQRCSSCLHHFPHHTHCLINSISRAGVANYTLAGPPPILWQATPWGGDTYMNRQTGRGVSHITIIDPRAGANWLFPCLFTLHHAPYTLLSLCTNTLMHMNTSVCTFLRG